jgi:hypothetical protein
MLVNDIISLIQALVAIIRLCDQVKGTRKEIRDLKARAKVVMKLLEDNKTRLSQDDGLNGLAAVLDEIREYLENRKVGWFYRNPVMEKVFFFKIDSFEKKLDSWSITMVLSLSVRAPKVFHSFLTEVGKKSDRRHRATGNPCG